MKPNKIDYLLYRLDEATNSVAASAIEWGLIYKQSQILDQFVRKLQQNIKSEDELLSLKNAAESIESLAAILNGVKCRPEVTKSLYDVASEIRKCIERKVNEKATAPQR